MQLAATTYEISLFPAPVVASAPPSSSFVSRLVASLVETFALDAKERDLASLVLHSRTPGSIARHFRVPGREVQAHLRALFTTTCCTGREQLFELALRLTTMRELSQHVMHASRA